MRRNIAQSSPIVPVACGIGRRFARLLRERDSAFPTIVCSGCVRADAPSRRLGGPSGPAIRASCRTLYHMVNYHKQLDRTFAALADPTRRAILARLERQDSASVSELARPFAIKLPAVMKHLDVLNDAGLITRSKKGRTVTVRLASDPIREAVNWLQRYARLWSGSLNRLAAYAEGKAAEASEADR